MMIVIMMIILSYTDDDDCHYDDHCIVHGWQWLSSSWWSSSVYDAMILIMLCIVYAWTIYDVVLFCNERTNERTRRFYELEDHVCVCGLVVLHQWYSITDFRLVFVYSSLWMLPCPQRISWEAVLIKYFPPISPCNENISPEFQNLKQKLTSTETNWASFYVRIIIHCLYIVILVFSKCTNQFIWGHHF